MPPCSPPLPLVVSVQQSQQSQQSPRGRAKATEIHQMQRLEEWIGTRGFELECSPGAEDCVIFGSTRMVSINSRQSRRSKIATLLHECGHILIYEARRRSKNPARPVAGASFRDWETETRRYAPKSRSRKVAVLTEELEAWERGWALGRRLRSGISKKYYDGIRIKAVMTYVRATSASP